MITMTTLKDVPKAVGVAMHSQKSEQQISLEDIFTMIFQLFICGKKFWIDSRISGTLVNGLSFRLFITQEKSLNYNDTFSFEVEGWQLQRLLFAVELFKQYPELRHQVRTLALLRGGLSDPLELRSILQSSDLETIASHHPEC